jgi:hypothetical protein
MTSLLERMNIDNPAGPTRTGKKSDRASPYVRCTSPRSAKIHTHVVPLTRPTHPIFNNSPLLRVLDS